MDFNVVATIGGYKSHLTTDGKRTLCGREVSNSTGDWDPCKRCAAKRDKLITQENTDRFIAESDARLVADKLRADRERLEYYTRVDESQDGVMSQAAPVVEGKWDAVLRTTSHAGFNTVVNVSAPVVSGQHRVDAFMAEQAAEDAAQWADVTAGEAFDAGTPVVESERVPVLFPATSNVFIGSGPGGEHTMFADSIATVNEWLATGRVHKHTRQQVPTLAEVCVCPEPITPERVHTDVMVTDATGHRYTYASVPNGDPVRVALFVATAESAGVFTDVKAVPYVAPVAMHYGASRVLCGADPVSLGADHCKGGDGPCPAACQCGCKSGEFECECTNLTETIADVTCPECREGVHRPVDLPETTTGRAVNGHVMDYRVTGRDPESGRLAVSQGDAQHSDTCPCLNDGEGF